MWAFHTIPSFQFIVSYSNNILKYMLLNNITRFSETCMCLCSFKYLQHQILVLQYNNFTNKKTIGISQTSPCQSINIAKQMLGYFHNIILEKYTKIIFFGEVEHVYVSKAVYLSLDCYYQNYFTSMLINSTMIGDTSVNFGR